MYHPTAQPQYMHFKERLFPPNAPPNSTLSVSHHFSLGPPSCPSHQRASNCTILPTVSSAPNKPFPPPSSTHSPLSPLLVQNPMPTVLAPNGITLLQLHLLVALPTEILRCRTSVVDGGTEGGAGSGTGGGGLAGASGVRRSISFMGCHVGEIGDEV